MAIKLDVRNLRISFRTPNGTVKAVRGIDFSLEEGETLAIVGESGSGKSVTARAIMGILAGNSIVESGEIFYDGMDLMKIGEDDFHQLRGNRIAMIFQDPLSSLNPVMKIGRQLTEAMLLNGKSSQKDARLEYKSKMSALTDAMKQAAREKGRDAAEIEKNVKIFMDSMEKGSSLAGDYDETHENIANAESDIEGILIDIILGKPAVIAPRIKELLTDCRRCHNKYLIPEGSATFAAALSQLEKANDAYKSGGSAESVKQALEQVKQRLKDALELEMPDFFSLSYWLAKEGKEPEYDTIAQLNSKLNERAYADFMNAFLTQIADGMHWSASRSAEAKKKVLAETEDTESILSNPAAAATQYKAETKRVTRAVEESIDRLAIVKDSLAYTLQSSMSAAVDKYIEGKRLQRMKSKKKKARAALVDIELLRENIVLPIKRLRDDYRRQLSELTETDWNAEALKMVHHIQDQCLRMVHKVTKATAKAKAIKIMEEVGIPEPRRRYKQYPFEFSGGMRQRIVIAIALSANPDILICDEPTTALDVTIQSQILELINKLKGERNLSIIFITHDLGVVANMADNIAVMYAGKIVETGKAEEVFYDPRHPYTWALLSAMPDLETREKLEAIPGTPPNMIFPPKGDAFAERNRYAMEIDFEEQPPMFDITPTHKAATWLLHPEAPHVDPPKIVTDRIERMKKLEEEYNG